MVIGKLVHFKTHFHLKDFTFQSSFSLRVTTSIYPVPSICAQDQISDWFDSLAECLHWNVRKRQKCLDELSDLTGSGSEDTFDELERGMENLES
jgi:NAD+ kinase